MSDSTIERVTFFEDRVEVARRARVVLDVGVHDVRIDGLALTVDDSSVVAGIAEGAGARVLSARVRRSERQEPVAGPDEIATLQKELDAARTRQAIAERGLARAQAEMARLTTLLKRWTAALERVPRGGEAEMKKWRAAHDSVDAALCRTLDDVAARQAELTLAQLDGRRVDGRLQQARMTTPRFSASAELRVEVTGAKAEQAIDLRYRTPLALWRPEHAARLVPRADDAKKWDLVIKTIATVWQRTGESWRDVPCRFSTARPTQTATPPLLSDDVVRLQKKQDRSVTVALRDETIQHAGLDRGARAVDEMPGVEDGGEPLTFVASQKTTIPSDGQPFRVEIGERRLPCEVDVVVFPERGDAAHVRVTATLTGKTPLLAGPVRLARGGSIVGRGKTAFVAPGEPFELGFGVDDGLRVRRRIDEERDTTAIIGTQKIKRTLQLYVSNLSGEARQLKVIERIPVSEIGDVTIAVLDKGGAQIDDDGYARFAVDIAANATRTLTLIYKIEAAAKVRLPF